jgi:enoyl-CoA hydratase/carnithine racemase
MTESGHERASEVRYEVSDHVARVTIDRESKRNALSFDTTSQLRECFRNADGDREVRVIVLSGAGEQAFCAGADLGGIRGGRRYRRFPRETLPQVV